VGVYADNLDPPAASGQSLNHGSDDGFHCHHAVRRHINVATEAVDDVMGLNRVAASDD
jgi:hypothetical protein